MNRKLKRSGQCSLLPSCLFAVLILLSAGSKEARAQSPSPSIIPGANTGAKSAIEFIPSKLSFTDQAINQASAALSVTLRNPQAEPSSLSIVISGGNAAGDFAAGGDCPTPPSVLRLGESCRVTVTFTPSAAGLRNAMLTVKPPDHEVLQSLPLTGMGIVPTDIMSNRWVMAEEAPDSGSSTIALEIMPSQKLTHGRAIIPGARVGNGTLPVTLVPLSSTGTAIGLVSIVVTPTNPSIAAGSTQQFTATGIYTDGTTVNLTGSVGWGTSAATIASINGAGLATGVAAGSAVITASYAAATSPPVAKADSVSAPPIVVSPPSVLEGSTTLTVTTPAGATFTTTGNLNAARAGHTATLLNNGQVLIAGGAIDSSLDPTGAAEIYDPTLGTSTITGSMNTPRYFSTATLLNNGLVLVAGGLGPGGLDAEPINSAELFNPATGSFTYTGNLNTARALHTATLLPSGQVLMVGGSGGDSTPVSTAEIYDPLSGSFTQLDFYLNYARYAHTATLLPAGTVLIAGGYNDGALNTAELYDPAAQAFVYTTNPSTGQQTYLNDARYYHSATLLNDGQVLLVGGVGQSTSTDLASAELYNPATQTFTYTGSLATLVPTGLDSQTATLLNDAMVLVAGGEDYNQNPLATASVYNPATGTFTATGNLKVPVDVQTATLLNNGTVLLAGGFSDAGGDVTASAEFYTPLTLTPPNLTSIALSPVGPTIPLGSGIRFTATGNFSGGDAEELNEVTWTSSNPGVVSVSNDASNSGEAWAAAAGSATITACAGVVCGSTTAAVGAPGAGSITGSGAFNVTGPMVFGRVEHTATLLPNGQVLLAGGLNYSYGFLSSAELFDPNAGTFTSTGNLITARESHTATLLNNGLILLAGGYGPTGYLRSAELYNPATGTFAPTGNLNVARYSHTATLLPDGQVLIVGGTGLDGILTSAELYDPLTGTFSLTGSMGDARLYHTATLLNNGQVLIAGGINDDGLVEPAELYNPATGIFAFTGSLNTLRQQHTATLLNNGMVLIAGGTGSFGFLAAAELYNPLNGMFTPTGSLNYARRWHTATLLTNGLVLLAGGAGNSLSVSSSAELYDAASGVFGITGSLNTTHQQATATLLNNGTVLIAGGYDINEFTPPIAELYDPATLTPPNLVSISIAPTNPTVPLGTSMQLAATGTFSNGNNEQLAEVVWTSSNPGVVSVSDDATNAGAAWAAAEGLATVTACAGFICGSTTLTVAPGLVSIVVTPPSATIALGLTAQFSAIGIFTDGSKQDLTSSVSWSSSVPSVATIDAGGLASGLGTGTTTMTAASGAVEGSATLMVMTGPVLTGSMATPRVLGTATLLDNGQVLMVGGYNSSGYLASAELYNPATGIFTATGSLNTPRSAHTATLLNNGMVLIAGGENASGALASAEIYNPSTGTFSYTTTSLNTARYYHTTTLLASGQVLIAGGDGASGALASAELYDPTTETFTFTVSLNTARAWHTATLLNNGQVLMAGGENSGGLVDSAELYDPNDPNSGVFIVTGALNTARELHTATLLIDGQVLLAGGLGSGGAYLASAETYDPGLGIFLTVGSLNTPRVRQSAALLNNGSVLVAGGENASGFLASEELFDPATGAFTPTDNLIDAVSAPSATLLSSGQVLIAGGYDSSGYFAAAELFAPATLTPPGLQSIAITPATSTLSPGTTQHFIATGTFSDGSTAQLAGVAWSSSNTNYAQISNDVTNPGLSLAGGAPASNTDVTITATAGTVSGSATLTVRPTGFVYTGNLNSARYNHTATVLNNGLVLIAGGGGGSGVGSLASAELYNPATGTFTPTGNLNTAREEHTATLLNNGMVLIAGGYSTSGEDALASAEIYNPATGTFTLTGSLNTARYTHTATLLNNGMVLIAGGFDTSVLSSAELYDPATGTFTSTGSLNSPRNLHTATLLNNDMVLIAGGYNASGTTLASAELYNPVTGAFTLTGNLNMSREFHTATLLNNGMVLIAGGLSPGISATAELYNPATGAFTLTGNLNTARYSHTATLLNNGMVLVAGGNSNGTINGDLSSTELF